MDQSMNIVEIRKNMADALNRVAYSGDRIVLQRRGKGVAALVSMDDLKLLRRAEDEFWANEALKAEAEAEAKGEKPIPLAEVERMIDESRRKGGKSRRRVRRKAR